MRRRVSLVRDMIRLSILPLVVMGFLLLAVTAYSLSVSMEQEIEDSLNGLAKTLYQTYETAYPGDFRMENGRLMKGDYDLTGNITLVDGIKQASGCDATLFFGDMRLLTSIRNRLDSRASGTHAAPEVTKVVIGRGETYYSRNVSVNGTPYFGYYMPMLNSDGAVSGMLFVGKSQQSVREAILSALTKIALVTLGAMAVAGFLAVLYARKVIHVLGKTKEFLGEIAQGNLDVVCDPCLTERNDEIGAMGKFAVILQKSITDLVGTDPLTGLHNRRSGQVTLENAVRSFQRDQVPFSVAIGDIDDFKLVNDNHGHLCGDAVLRELSTVFQVHMASKGYVFRWGGEEFLFVYDGLHMGEARQDLDQLRDRVKEHIIFCAGDRVQVTMTFGMAEFQDSTDLDGLLRRADENLYWGKAHQKNQVVA